MKSTITLLFLSLFSLSFIQAQNDFDFDTKGGGEETIFGDGSINLSGAWGGSNNSMISIDGNKDLSSGGYFVFEFNNDYLLGWSGYGSSVILENDQKAKMKGNDLLIGYTYNSNKTIHPVGYLKAGVAELEIGDGPSDDVGIIEPTIGVEANITRWFRLGVEGGYRMVTNVDLNGYNNADFSSPILGLRLKFGWSWD